MTEQPAPRFQLWTPAAQDGQAGLAMGLEGLARVAIGVFETIEVVLEGAVVCGDQRLHRRHVGRPPAPQPAVGIAARQSPVHDSQALVEHPPIGQNQHRHRALGGGLQQLGGLGLQVYLPQLQIHPRPQASRRQRQSRPDRVGAAPEAVEDRPEVSHWPGHARSGAGVRQSGPDRNR